MDKTQLKNSYRRLIRISKYYGPHSLQLCGLIRTRIRQNYSSKYLKLTGNQFQHESDIPKRLENTINFLNNALVGDGGVEIGVIKSIIQYEASKSVNNRLRLHFNETTELKNIKKFKEIREIERATFMNGGKSPWFLKNGEFDDEFSFGYIEVLQKLLKQDKSPLIGFHSGIIDFENVLIAFNEENNLLL